MCLVSVLPKGTVKYNKTVEEFIEAGFTSNKDGSGIMWKRDKDTKVSFKKGFFDLPQLQDFISALKLKEEDELVVHHRVGTQGLISKGNTHPFVITGNHDECVAEEGISDKPVLVHNGIFRHLSKYDHTEFSDTYSFCNGLLSKKYLMDFFEDDTALFLKTFDTTLGWSKICILFPGKDLLMTGDFTLDGGYYHSNDCYKDRDWRDSGGYGRYAHWNNERSDIVYLNTRKEKKRITGTINIMDSISNPLPNESTSFVEGIVNNAFSKYVPIRKLVEVDYKINALNAIHFVYMLKDKCKVGDLQQVVGYRVTNYNEESNMCNLYVPSNKSMLYTVRITELKNMFYYTPTTEFQYMYNDFLYLQENLTPSKTQVKKLEKQLSSKFNQDDKSRFIIKKLGTLCSKAGVRMWLEKNRPLFYKKQTGLVTYVVAKDGSLEEKKRRAIDVELDSMLEQEEREFKFTDSLITD